VSNLGHVRHDIASKRFAGKLLKGIKNREGYLQVSLYRNGIPTSKLVHLLVAHAFVPNPDDHPIVLHLDDNKANPRADNLVWGTHSDNAILTILARYAIKLARKYPRGYPSGST
jgi:hypothetical protein